MSAPKVRTDHLQLKEAATRFVGQAQAAQQSLKSLKGQLDVLEGGDWQGLGASAFYQEMSSQVLPAVQRLAAALESAQTTTLQIGQLMEQAEADAAAVLRGDGAAGDGSGLAGAAGGAAGAGGAGGRGSPLAAGPGFISVRPPNLRAMRQAMARQRAKAQDAAVDKMLSIFSPDVRALANKSPTLRAQMLTLQKKGFMFLTGTAADGNKTIPPQITIVQPMTAAETVAMIGHEVGHAVNIDKEIKRVVETPTMTRAEYVRLNVANNLRNEATAQFNAMQVRAEIQAAGGGDIGVPGTAQTAAYSRVYADYAAGRITKDQAIDRMAPIMGNDTRSFPPPPQTYRDYSVDFYRNDWDTYIAPARAPKKGP